MSNTKNVKLGVCWVSFDGVDLGLTKGGVEVEVTTDTYKSMVDQFGQSEINESILKRTVMAKVPLAETHVENLVNIMPGATLIDNSTKQVDTCTIDTAGNSQVYTITLDGVVYSYTSDASATEGEIALGLVAAVNDSGAARSVASTTAIATDVAATVVLTARIGGDVVVVASGADTTTVNTTPAVVGAKRVQVTNAIGTDLLSIAKKLVIHPKAKPYSDRSEDFVIPLAATAGAMSFSYQLEEERVFPIEFVGYPDSATELLFEFGDPAAV